MTILALAFAAAAMAGCIVLGVVVDRQRHTIDRLAQDVDDLWGPSDTLYLDTPDVAETPHDARLGMTQRLINNLYEEINHD